MMPELVHNLSGESGDKKFDIMKSEVAAWLVEQPGIRQFVFNKIREAGMIAYDGETGTWKGVGTENYKRQASTGGRPSLFSADMIIAALTEAGGKGMENRSIRKLMTARGMSENTYYRLRGIAQAAGKIELSSQGSWRVVDVNRAPDVSHGTIPSDTSSNPNKNWQVSRVSKPDTKPKRLWEWDARLTDEQAEKLIEAMPTMRQTKGDEFFGQLTYVVDVQRWIEKNVLNREAYDVQEIYCLTGNVLKTAGNDRLGTGFKVNPDYHSRAKTLPERPAPVPAEPPPSTVAPEQSVAAAP